MKTAFIIACLIVATLSARMLNSRNKGNFSHPVYNYNQNHDQNPKMDYRRRSGYNYNQSSYKFNYSPKGYYKVPKVIVKKLRKGVRKHGNGKQNLYKNKYAKRMYYKRARHGKTNKMSQKKYWPNSPCSCNHSYYCIVESYGQAMMRNRQYYDSMSNMSCAKRKEMAAKKMYMLLDGCQDYMVKNLREWYGNTSKTWCN